MTDAQQGGGGLNTSPGAPGGPALALSRLEALVGDAPEESAKSSPSPSGDAGGLPSPLNSASSSLASSAPVPSRSFVDMLNGSRAAGSANRGGAARAARITGPSTWGRTGPRHDPAVRCTNGCYLEVPDRSKRPVTFTQAAAVRSEILRIAQLMMRGR